MDPGDGGEDQHHHDRREHDQGEEHRGGAGCGGDQGHALQAGWD